MSFDGCMVCDRSRDVWMVPDLSRDVWMVPDRSRDVWIDREMCGWYPIDREMCGWTIDRVWQPINEPVCRLWRVDTKIIEDEAIRQMIVKHTISIELSTYTNKHPGIAITPGWWDLVTKGVDKELVTKEVFYCCASSPFLPNKHKQTS